MAEAVPLFRLSAEGVEPITLGVVGDTHIPDREAGLHPEILPRFQQEKVAVILHTGDASIPAVLQELEACAPVLAVRGNRDRQLLRALPLERVVEVGALKIGLLHGHGDTRTYLRDSFRAFLRGGLPFSYYLQRVRGSLPQAQVVVFGHIHLPINFWEDGRLLFNPGSASQQISPNIPPSLGLLRVHPGGSVQGEIVFLARRNSPKRSRKWLPSP